jgi:peptidoglycan/LPS O-acetylase OafA/YrhL
MADPLPKPHLAYIDCVRGYAVLMVLTSHLTFEFPELPFPVHRLTSTGWFGVQLFFLASAVTLMMSRNSEMLRTGSVDLTAFFLRRFFRIAPAYYAAGIFYYLISPPAGGFDAVQMITSMLFVNAWHPVWTPTVPTAWAFVPGGWSIGVEFTFYLLFPLFAAWCTNLWRALLIFAVSVAIGVVCNHVAMTALRGSYGPEATEIFLFFWFPNQMSVFALGGVLFFLLRTTGQPGRLQEGLHRHGSRIAMCAVAGFIALAYVPLGHHLGAQPYFPASLAVSAVMMVFLIGLSANGGPFVNRYAAAMGEVSFSAYLLHFAVLKLFGLFPGVLHTDATGVWAIAAFAAGWIVAVVITYGAAWASHRVIEEPMINVGKALIRARRSQALTASTR